MGKSSRNRHKERGPHAPLTEVAPRARTPLTTQLNQIMDMRVRPWSDPLSYLPALDLVGAASSVGATAPSRNKNAPVGKARLRFDAPHEAIVCVRRQQRKEVLFAKKRTGKGAKSKKHFNRFSRTYCK